MTCSASPRFLRWLFLLVAATLGLMRAMSAEDRVDLGDGLNGAWITPDTRWDGRTALLLHGFADDMDGAGDLYRRLASDLAGAGIASLRLNLRGEGDRHRTNLLSTFHTRLADATNGLLWLAGRPGVDRSRVAVVGWSLGGATAAAAAATWPERVRCLVFWSTVSGDLGARFREGDFGRTAEEAARAGIGTLEIQGWKTVTLRREFFDSYQGVRFEELLSRYPGPFLSVRGSADYLPAVEPDLVKLPGKTPREAQVLGGADHIFNVFSPDSPHARRVREATVDWLKREL